MDRLHPTETDAWFAFTREAGEDEPKIGLSLAHERGRLHVPNIVPLDAGDLSIDQYNRILDEFEDTVRTHVPPDSELDVRVTSDRAAITDWVSSDAADLLKYFSTLANMSTGAGHPLDGVDPIPWTPQHCAEEVFPCRKLIRRTRRSTGARWSS